MFSERTIFTHSTVNDKMLNKSHYKSNYGHNSFQVHELNIKVSFTFIPFLSQKDMASSLVENSTFMFDRGSALKK